VTSNRSIAEPPSTVVEPRGGTLATTTDRLPALRTPFDGLLDLADEIELRARERRVPRPYDPVEAKMRAQRQASAAAVGRPPEPLTPLSTLTAARPTASTPTAGADAPSWPPWLLRVAVASAVLLVVATVAVVAVDRVGQLVDRDEPSLAPAGETSQGGEGTPAAATGEPVPEQAEGAPPTCPEPELLGVAQAVTGQPELVITSALCSIDYAVARVGPPDQGVGGAAWLAFRLDESAWQALALGWIEGDADWIADCLTVQTEIDPSFPAELCA
jgi:hypothetical protein